METQFDHNPVTIIARLNGCEVYRRVLKGFLSQAGLEGSIAGSIKHDFKNFVCEVIR